ncbi:MAG: hypothetical protein D6797_03910 [Bdellovibrio sp.]|nr:MAG: hypothetical protein D6797_03910 [Bdellovibrio sp.]
MENQLFRDKKEGVQVRCPKCFKLYVVPVHALKDKQTQFTCLKCQEGFWLPYPECLEQKALIGLPLEWLEKNKEPSVSKESVETAPETSSSNLLEAPFRCPQCGRPSEPAQKECGYCGVVFEKLKSRDKEEEPSASLELKKLWQSLLEDYNNEQRHEAFLEQALRENALEFAAYKYRGILDSCGEDTLAKKFLNQIEALTLVRPEMQNLYKKPSRKPRRFFTWTSLIIALSTFLVVFGYWVPQMRNLMGLGASILFITLALKYYFKIFP